jgi:hypothetical protein
VLAFRIVLTALDGGLFIQTQLFLHDKVFVMRPLRKLFSKILFFTSLTYIQVLFISIKPI